MTEPMRRAQWRYDGAEPPEGIDDETIETAAREVVGGFGPLQFFRFARAVEDATGAARLTDHPALLRVWQETHPDPDEE